MTKIPGQSSRSSRGVQNTPMSERQQMALLMQMTSGEYRIGPSRISEVIGNRFSDTTSSSAATGPGSGFQAGSSSAGSGSTAAGNTIGSSTPARYRDKNGRGESVLHVAAIKGDYEQVKKLLDQGVPPNVTDNAGGCAIELGKHYISSISLPGWTPLHEACNHGHFNVASILIKAGGNVNAKGYEDVTPLHDAALVGQLKLVKLLLSHGADPKAKNAKGKAPLDIAASAVYQYIKGM